MSYNNVTLVSPGSGYITMPSIVYNGGYSISAAHPQLMSYSYKSLVVSDDSGNPMIVFQNDGTICVKANIDAAAEQFVKLVNSKLDKKALSKSALLRSYMRANERILKMAKRLSREELIAQLELEQDERLYRSVQLTLEEENE